MRKLAYTLAALLSLSAFFSGPTIREAEAIRAELHWSTVVAFPALEFEQPVDLRHAPGYPDLLFVVERAGRILSFKNDPLQEDSTVFLDIRELVRSTDQEEGLLGLCFIPNSPRTASFTFITPLRGAGLSVSRAFTPTAI
jgi:hypothetical protein